MCGSASDLTIQSDAYQWFLDEIETLCSFDDDLMSMEQSMAPEYQFLQLEKLNLVSIESEIECRKIFYASVRSVRYLRNLDHNPSQKELSEHGLDNDGIITNYNFFLNAPYRTTHYGLQHVFDPNFNIYFYHDTGRNFWEDFQNILGFDLGEYDSEIGMYFNAYLALYDILKGIDTKENLTDCFDDVITEREYMTTNSGKWSNQNAGNLYDRIEYE